MQSLCKTDTWLPRCSWSAAGGAVIDQEFHDFDDQSQRLASHGQEYLQLTKGAFYGRFVSCILGPNVSLHIEHANQALSQAIAGAPDVYAIGVVLSEGSEFRANGVSIGCDSIFIVPPGVDFHLFSPKSASILACVTDRDFLESNLAALPQLYAWFEDLPRDIIALQSASLAESLRQNAYSALLGCLDQTPHAVDKNVLGDALIKGFVAKLTLEAASALSNNFMRSPNTFEHFSQLRGRLYVPVNGESEDQSVFDSLPLSKRSVQHAFAQEGGLGVSGYIRHLRLHAVRRSLRAGDTKTSTIGDIAARHGFWNWSHFSQQYRQMFGELPSETLCIS